MNDTVTIVTGAAQGIGQSIAEFLAEKGGDIAIFDIVDGTDLVKGIRNRGVKRSSSMWMLRTPTWWVRPSVPSWKMGNR